MKYLYFDCQTFNLEQRNTLPTVDEEKEMTKGRLVVVKKEEDTFSEYIPLEDMWLKVEEK